MAFPYITIDTFQMTTKDRTDINTWSDLTGEKVGMGSAGSNNGMYEVFEILGVKPAKAEAFGYIDQIETLRRSAMDSITAYTHGLGYALGDWVLELDKTLRNLKAVAFTEAERAKCKGKVIGFPIPETSLEKFTQDVGMKKAGCVQYISGVGASPTCDEEHVYQMLKCWWDHKDELGKKAPVLEYWAKHGEELVAAAVNCIPGYPVHPGLYRLWQERGLPQTGWVKGVQNRKISEWKQILLK